MYDFQFSDSAFATHKLLRQAWIAVSKAMEYRLAKVGLTPEKLAILWACRDYPGTLTPSELARLLFREAQTIVGALNRMEREGLIKRIPKRKGKPLSEALWLKFEGLLSLDVDFLYTARDSSERRFNSVPSPSLVGILYHKGLV